MVKKILLISILLLSLEETTGQVKYGVKAGVNVNTTNTFIKDAPSWVDYENDVENTVGFHAGFFFVIDLGEKFSFRPELEYIQKGYRYNYIDLTQKVTLNYVDLPLLFSYKIANKFYVEAGPAFGYLFSSKSDNDIFVPPSEIYKLKFEVAALGGLRYTLFKNFNITARYNLGLTDLTDETLNVENPNTNEIETFEYVAKNRLLIFSIAYSFK